LKHINRNSKLSYICIENNLISHFKNLPENEKPGLILGTAFGSVDSIGSFWETYLTEGNGSLRPLDFPNTVINSGSSFINIRYLLSDISATVCTGYNSSHDAFIYAHDYIVNGYSDFLLVGGTEELGKYLFLGQEKSGVISSDGKMNMFGKFKSGYVPGEGSAFFIVESIEHAEKRNANILAELAGFSSNYSNDKFGNTIKSYNEALDMAGITINDLDMISSSANGTSNDDIIVKVYEHLLKNLNRPVITSHKQYFGECYGAGGAMQIAASLSNSRSKKVSPVFSENKPDNIPLMPETKTERNIKYFAVDGISCEGNSIVLIFKNHN
jgi:3-oxoacyl-[acyl-carrier-protein] synthase II